MTTPTLWFIIATLVLFAIVLMGRKMTNRNITQYGSDEIKSGIKSGKMVLLDVRSDQERAWKSIPKSLHIPLPDISRRADELKKFQGKEIVCYCHRGTRSLAAADQLGKLGYTTASMKGGIAAWDAKGNKV